MAAKSVLPPLWEVPQEFRDRLGEQAGRQRAMLADGHLLLVLRQPPTGEDGQREGRYFWRSPDGAWTCSDLRGRPNVLKIHLDEYENVVERYDEQAEQAVSAEDHFSVLSGLAPIHRSARHLHQTLQEARQMCPEDRDLIILRDRAYEIERAAELLYHEAKNSLDFAVAKRTEEQAESTYKMAASAHRLNLLVAFFFPLATLGALFGVNLRFGLEELSPPLPFLVVVMLGLAAGFVLKSFVTRP